MCSAYRGLGLARCVCDTSAGAAMAKANEELVVRKRRRLRESGFLPARPATTWTSSSAMQGCGPLSLGAPSDTTLRVEATTRRVAFRGGRPTMILTAAEAKRPRRVIILSRATAEQAIGL